MRNKAYDPKRIIDNAHYRDSLAKMSDQKLAKEFEKWCKVIKEHTVTINKDGRAC